jgi:hypothetical protein
LLHHALKVRVLEKRWILEPITEGAIKSDVGKPNKCKGRKPCFVQSERNSRQRQREDICVNKVYSVEPSRTEKTYPKMDKSGHKKSNKNTPQELPAQR